MVVIGCGTYFIIHFILKSMFTLDETSLTFLAFLNILFLNGGALFFIGIFIIIGDMDYL